MKDRTLLMIPGPVEFEPAVLAALGSPTNSHVAPDFIETFGRVLEKMRRVWFCPKGQPFVIAGTGTLAMEIPAANLIEPGDKVLVLSTGYFGERYAEILSRYGADVKKIESEPGDAPDPDLVEKELKKGGFKLLTFTHVDTSTAVRVDPRPLGKLGRKYGVLTILDGVCSVAGEEILQEEWDIDVVLTASQKAVGVPPGLALLVAGSAAMQAWRKRKKPVANYYADWTNWLPVMEAYEARKPSYFGTPAVNLVCALDMSLTQILEEGMEARFSRHRRLGTAFQAALDRLGLSQIPLKKELRAATLSAPYYPKGISGPQLLPLIKKSGVIVAGGLHPKIKDRYFRIGHMGAVRIGDVLSAVGAIENGLFECGFLKEIGSGVEEVLSVFQKN